MKIDPAPGAGIERRAALLVSLALLAVVANALWLLPMRDDLGVTQVVLGMVVAAMFASAGAVAMLLRPGNPTGRAMLALALIVNVGEGAFETLAPWRFTLGRTLAEVPTTLLAFLALSFPRGRLRGWWVWLICVLLGGLTAFLTVSYALWLPPGAICANCAPAGNLLFVGDPPFDVRLAIERLRVPYGLMVLLVMITLLARWLRASGPARRALGPVVLTTILLTAKATLDIVVLGPELQVRSFSDLRISVIYPNQLLTALIPFAFLLAVVRSEFGRSPLTRLLSDVVDESAPARLDRALAKALNDPSVRVGYSTADAAGFVDLDGRAMELPAQGAATRATPLGDLNDPFAVIVHDAAFAEDDPQLEAAAAAAAMALRRERLLAELRVRLHQLTDSRERLIHTVEDQRARMESALEAGVEDRLVELAALLGDLRREIDSAPAVAAVDNVAAEVGRARSDLRAFVRGVRPPVVAAEGLASALRTLAASAGLPVAVECPSALRLPADVESTIWFVCSESLVNVTKHACASRAAVDVRADGDTIRVTVADDGLGGASPEGGSGLRGLRERIESLGGTLLVTSSPGSGTTVHAELPLGARAERA